MRWLVRSTSSSSDEMNTQDMPSSARDEDELLDVGLGPDVDAAGRLVEDEQARARRQPAGEDHLLLVAAAQVLDRLVGRRRGDVEELDVALGDLVLLARARGAGTSRGWPASPGRCSRGRSGRRRSPRPCGPPGRARRRARSSRPARSRGPACRPCVSEPSVGRSMPNRSWAISVRPEPSRPASPTTSPAWSTRSNGSIEPVRPSPSRLEQRVGADVLAALHLVLGRCRRARSGCGRASA